jgi:hypothetical protein
MSKLAKLLVMTKLAKLLVMKKIHENEGRYFTKQLPNYNYHDHIKARRNDGRVYWLPSCA